MTARQKTYELLYKLEKAGIPVNFDEANQLRRAEITLQRWSEKECGTGNDYNSWAIQRDEETGKPFMHVYPHTGQERKYQIADLEKGALKRVQEICKRNGIFFYHQTDPRGCALYVSASELTEQTYYRGVACSI